MKKVKKRAGNPHGLTTKQDLVIKDIVQTMKDGGKFDPRESTKKFYNVTSEASAATCTTKNLQKENFRDALLGALTEANIIGVPNSKIGKRLQEGLDAVKLFKDELIIDFDSRLKYVQEINKISGVYAPTKTERKSLSLNVDMSDKELEMRISQLQEELKS